MHSIGACSPKTLEIVQVHPAALVLFAIGLLEARQEPASFEAWGIDARLLGAAIETLLSTKKISDQTAADLARFGGLCATSALPANEQEILAQAFSKTSSGLEKLRSPFMDSMRPFWPAGPIFSNPSAAPWIGLAAFNPDPDELAQAMGLSVKGNIDAMIRNMEGPLALLARDINSIPHNFFSIAPTKALTELCRRVELRQGPAKRLLSRAAQERLSHASKGADSAEGRKDLAHFASAALDFCLQSQSPYGTEELLSWAIAMASQAHPADEELMAMARKLFDIRLGDTESGAILYHPEDRFGGCSICEARDFPAQAEALLEIEPFTAAEAVLALTGERGPGGEAESESGTFSSSIDAFGRALARCDSQRSAQAAPRAKLFLKLCGIGDRMAKAKRSEGQERIQACIDELAVEMQTSNGCERSGRPSLRV